MPDQSLSPVPRLEMRGIRKTFGATVALEAVDFAVQAGEIHALVGENGAGKSTLMKVISGALQPDAGGMRFDGRAYAPRHPLDARRAGVSMIYQELSLAPHLSVEDNIVLGVEPARRGILNRRAIRDLARGAFERLGHADVPLDEKAGRLSPAARQSVEIARSLAVGCRVLILDEPTSSLSQADAERLFSMLVRLKEQGQAIVYISHFLEEVKRVSDRFTVLRDGRTAGTGPTASTPVQDIVRLMVGQRVDDLYRRSPHAAEEVVLDARELAGHTKPVSASLALHAGEVLGIAGLVGSGRTEFLRALFGLDPIRTGQVSIGAYSGAAMPRERWRQGVGLLSEDRKNEGLALSMSVADNLTLTRLRGLGSWGLIRRSRQHAVCRDWIRRLGIRCRDPLQRTAELSGGNQQKVALARLLHHDVDILLLDEPTRGIDLGSKASIYRLIDELVSGKAGGTRPKAVLMVSSYLPELLGMCDRIAVMCRGVLADIRPAREWNEHALMAAATGVGEEGVR